MDTRTDFRKALDTQRAEAVFLSALTPRESYTPAQVLAEIAATVLSHHGQAQTCADCAGEYFADCGDHESVSAERMRWALELAASLPLTVVQLGSMTVTWVSS